MERIEFDIKLLTPIWTGDENGRPQGLKMSGVTGGMRMHFEELVRAHGGYACECTGENGGCEYKGNNSDFCAACRIFGTGRRKPLSAIFKPRWDLDKAKIVLPEEDPLIHNRSHWTLTDLENENPKMPERKRTKPERIWLREGPGFKGPNLVYKSPCSIDTWIATPMNPSGDVLKPGDHNGARDILEKCSVAYTDAQADGNTTIRVVPLRPWRSSEAKADPSLSHEELKALLSYLLAFLSKYRGLGSKTNQGWGAFDLLNVTDMNTARGESLLLDLIRVSKQGNVPQTGLPTSSEYFSVEYNLGKVKPGFGFTWQNGRVPPDPYLQVGFALAYRLRRQIKFYSLDSGAPLPAGVNGPAWISAGHRNAPCKLGSAFSRVLFGQDDNGNNSPTGGSVAGLVGCSHAFKRGDTWFIRLSGRIPNAPPSCYNGLTWNAHDVRDFVIAQFDEMLGSPKGSFMVTGGNLQENQS